MQYYNFSESIFKNKFGTVNREIEYIRMYFLPLIIMNHYKGLD